MMHCELTQVTAYFDDEKRSKDEGFAQIWIIHGIAERHERI